MYENYFAGSTVDMLEFAMWWEGVDCRTKQGEPQPDWTCGYGAFGADGIFAPRQDLGGIEAMRKGVEKIHKYGRRIQLYVSSDIVQINNSSFFNSSWPWQRWADWPTAEAPAFPHRCVSLCLCLCLCLCLRLRLRHCLCRCLTRLCVAR